MFLTKKFAIAFFLFALVVALYHLSLLSTLDKATRAILNPLQAQAISLAQNTNTELSIALSSKRALLTQVRRLEKKTLELTSEILALQKIKQENEELRAILKFGTETRFTILPSRIIHITNKDGEQAILLDNGAKDGIVKGNAVVVLNGTIIGKVIEVSDEVARVRLTTDNKSAILATVGDGANFVAGVASGSQNTAIKLDLIPKNIPLSEGMRVYTNGLEEGIPSSLYIGSISALEESDNEIFNAAAIVPPYSIENFITASVITHS